LGVYCTGNWNLSIKPKNWCWASWINRNPDVNCILDRTIIGRTNFIHASCHTSSLGRRRNVYNDTTGAHVPLTTRHVTC
jgi:hypothetical protein